MASTGWHQALRGGLAAYCFWRWCRMPRCHRPRGLSGGVATVMPCTMASVPAREDKANWCGEQARWIGEAKCWAMLRDTTLRRMSPMTIPRTRPCGFCNATMRPNPRAVAVGGGMLAAASCCATWTNAFALSSSSSRSRNISAVRPDGPGAAPLRARSCG